MGKHLYNITDEGLQQHHPVLYAIEPKNRAEKRRCEADYQRVNKRFAELEELFYETLFSELPFSYEVIYTEFLDRFLNQVKFINEIIKPKYVVVNEHYFSDMFAPKEREV